MRLSTHRSGAALALVFAAFAAASDVVELNSKTFDDFIKGESLALVEWFAPWCGHCKALAPHYEESATALKEKGIKLAKVNCVDESELCQEHGVQGYPTLKVSRNGEYVDYTGPRQADGIIAFMTKQSLPAVSEVTADQLEEFKTSDKIVAIAYVDSSSSAPGPAFSEAANQHRDDYLFGVVSDKAAIEAAGVTPPALVLYRKFDEPSSNYPYPVAAATPKEIGDWIKDLSVPIIDEVGAENYQTYASSGKPLAYLFIDPTTGDKDAHVAMIKPIAEKYRGKINFVWIDSVKFIDHGRALNLNGNNWPAFVIQDLEKQLKYPLDQEKEVTAEAVEAWTADFAAGKLEPQLKSEAIPAAQDEPVFTLVGKQFDEVVFDDAKDVFVEFYAPWCGHCKRLKPTWDTLAEHFAGVKSHLTIAKMDATENDLPPSVPFRIAGFPTIKFKPAGSKDFVDYDGDRSLESLISFVEENAVNKLEPEEKPLSNETTPAQEPISDHSDIHDEL